MENNIADYGVATVPAEKFTESSLGYVTNLLARQFALAAQRRLARLGVQPGQLPALLQLYEREDRTQAELARTVGLEQPTMAKTLQRMERDGLVSRVPDPEDGRQTLIRLTAQARDLEPAVRAELKAVNTVAAGGMPRQDVQEFLRIAGNMLTNLQADRAE